jgi:hypothetical protein
MLEVRAHAERLHSANEFLIECRDGVVVVGERDADDGSVGDRGERLGPVVEDA